MTESPDWLEVCRACVGDVRGVLEELPGRAEREPVVGDGVGGDETTAIDAAAESVVVDRFRPLGVSIISEEIGALRGGGTVVVIDPIDGSLNAKRNIPFFALSIAVADGWTMGDVHTGYVYDFGSGEEWVARRGEQPLLNGVPITERPKEQIEILSLEATRTPLIAEHAPAVAELAYRLRIMGSLALSLCHLAAGRVDAVCSLKGARSVDIAAAQLLVRERGFAIELFDVPTAFAEAPLDLEGRSRVAAAGNAELCSQVADALSA